MESISKAAPQARKARSALCPVEWLWPRGASSLQKADNSLDAPGAAVLRCCARLRDGLFILDNPPFELLDIPTMSPPSHRNPPSADRKTLRRLHGMADSRDAVLMTRSRFRPHRNRASSLAALEHSRGPLRSSNMKASEPWERPAARQRLNAC